MDYVVIKTLLIVKVISVARKRWESVDDPMEFIKYFFLTFIVNYIVIILLLYLSNYTIKTMLKTKLNLQVVIYVSSFVGNPVSTWISSPILRVLKVSFTLFGARLTWKIYLKETLSIISSDPPCKDGNVRFTMSGLVRIKYQ